MTDSPAQIPQINLPVNQESILIPKINPQSITTPTPKVLNQNPPPPGKSPTQLKLKGLKTLWVVLGVILVFLFLVGLSLFNIAGNAKALNSSLKKLEAAGNSHDLDKVKTELGGVKKSLGGLSTSLKLVFWMKAIPFIGVYVSDADHAVKAGAYGIESAEILISTMEPYADIIGFKSGLVSKENKDGTKTTQERLDFIIKSIPSLTPQAGKIAEKVKLAKNEIDAIDPNRYPTKIGKTEIRERLSRGKELFDQFADLAINGKPLLEAAPYLLGTDSERNYLIIFQNDKELRPTGGFITAYSIMKVKDGRFEPVSSNDIYNLDAKYKPTIDAPEPVVKYLKGPYALSDKLRLRDLNWSPDYKTSAKTFEEEVGTVGISNVDGIIAVDTQLLVNLLTPLGKIGVPGFGNFSTDIVPECNCPQVIFELESFADVEGPIVWDPAGTGKIIYAPKNYENRKKIVGPLMNSIMANVLGQPKEKLPALFEAAFKSLTEKHILFYVNDKKAQEGVESFGIAGTIKNYDGDYLHINDSNLGGRKSNLYATQEVEQEFKIGLDGTIEKTVNITYKNPEKQDGWLNSVLPNWVRIYVPKGSQLLAFEGVEDKADAYEDLGKTVFAGFFKLRPQGVSKVTVKYKLPFKAKRGLTLLVQKQPGTDSPLYRTKIGRREDEFFLNTDKEIKLQ